jgi:quercetin dioxygenase-like cupin family protein
MGNFDKVELSGTEREDAIAAIQKQIAAWGLTMPSVQPLPLHFGLNRFSEIGETEFWVANDEQHGYCGKFLFLFDGQTCPYHQHEIKHETFFVLKGSIRMKLKDEQRVMRQGEFLGMSPGTGHSFTGLGPALVLEVSMPSILKDSFFADHNIGDNGVI